MSEHDDASKTEDATERRLSEGRERGQVAVSQEVKSAAMLLAATFGVIILAPPMMADVTTIGRAFLEQADSFPVGEASLQAGLLALVLAVGVATAPLAGLLLVVGLIASLGQVGLIWAPDRIQPEFSKISLLKGAKRLFSLRSIVEFLKGIAKLSLVAALAVGLALPLLADLELLPHADLANGLDRLQALTLRLVAGSAAVMAAISAVDYAYQRHAHLKQMRMTRQEVRDEHKQSEGDPHVKARIRRVRVERAQRRMMAKVPNADVVITNPTHYAVALEYKMESMAAPRVVAKGVDHVARKIREVAEEHHVPLIENPPLARALHAAVELDQMIPAEHYEAVAQVIGYVMRLKGRRT